MSGFKPVLWLVGTTACVFVVVRLLLGVTIVVVGDPMMAPALPSRDWIVSVSRFPAPSPGDVVVVDVQGGQQVRRVVATGGQTVRFRRGILHVEGVAMTLAKAGSEVRFSVKRADVGVEERRANVHRETVGSVSYDVFVNPRRKPSTKAKTVPEGHVFVACDNRAHCRDSRHFGTVPVPRVVAMRAQDALRRALSSQSP